MADQAEGKFKVRFMPSGKVVEASEGDNLLDVAIHADEFITATCGGKGVCGKCRVNVVEGEVLQDEADYLSKRKLDENEVLACKARVKGDVTIRVPEVTERFQATLVDQSEVLAGQLPKIENRSPLAQVYQLEMQPPTLDDPTGDFERVKRALNHRAGDNITASLTALNGMATSTRTCGWNASVAVVDRGYVQEVVEFACANSIRPYGLAIDLGTTTIVAYLVDLISGEVLGTATGLNRQIASGDDVISRIVFARKPANKKRLQKHAVDTINELIDVLTKKNEIDNSDILAVTMAGNTVMTHMLLGLDPANIRMEPYIPVATDLPVIPSEWIGIKAHPRAGVFLAPCNAAYVGGDITAGVLYTGFHREEALTLFVDVGTNGEMVLGGKDFLMTGACSAGPAFEGGGIEFGMRAIPGAIDTIKIDPETLEPTYTVVEGKKPRGICGSGLVDLLSGLFLTGALASNGKFADGLPEHLVREGQLGREYVLVPADKTAIGKDIIFCEADIDTLVRSKGAVYGAIQCLLKQAGLPLEGIERIMIAGGFGKHLNIQHTIDIGMFPDIDPAMYQYIGNSSLAGSYMTLLSKEYREEVRQIAKNMTYIDFSSSNLFFDEYQSALFLPHTDFNTFPSVKERATLKGKKS